MKQSLTIGISALNEAGNIGLLVKTLLKQKYDQVFLDHIIIQSDGSTDETGKIVRSIKNSKIILFENKSRKGLAYRYNQIINLTKSDILILLNADILPKGQHFINKLVAPIINNQADMTASKIEPIEPTKFFERMIAISMNLKDDLFDQINNGNNIYTCHGPARAFNNKAYSKLRFPDSVGEDAYSFLNIVHRGLRFKYVKSSVAFYKLPDNFKDHLKQSVRFNHSINRFKSHFDINFIKNQYSLSSLKLSKITLKYFMKYPLEVFSYIFLTLYLRIYSKFSHKTDNKFQTASSSKILMNGATK